MQPTPDAPRSPTRRPSPWLLAVVVAVFIAAAVAAVVIQNRDDDVGGELGAGAPVTVTTDPPSADSSTPAGATTSTTAGSPIPAAQRRLFDELQAQTAEVRGLAWRQPLNLRLVSRQELARRVVETNTRDTTPAQLAAEEATLKVFGFIPPNTDYAKLIDQLLAGGVLGFYDPKTREMFVGATETEVDGATRATIVHEMVHALTDQHFNYGPTIIALDQADKTEEAAAYSALLEGDARLSETLWMEKYLDPLEALGALLGGGSSDGAAALLQAPEYIQNALYFPYTDGLTFVEGLHEAGGFAAVDGAYRKPPTSTEHILHPATYSAGQGAAPPALPDVAAATGCPRVRAGAIGVYDMQALLDQHLSVSDAERAAQGWNGDSYTLVRCGNSLGLADRWEMDPGIDAGRLFEALGRWARSWTGRAVAADGRFSGPSGAGRIVRSGSRIELVLAQDVATADKLVAALG